MAVVATVVQAARVERAAPVVAVVMVWLPLRPEPRAAMEEMVAVAALVVLVGLAVRLAVVVMSSPRKWETPVSAVMAGQVARAVAPEMEPLERTVMPPRFMAVAVAMAAALVPVVPVVPLHQAVWLVRAALLVPPVATVVTAGLVSVQRLLAARAATAVRAVMPAATAMAAQVAMVATELRPQSLRMARTVLLVARAVMAVPVASVA